MAYLAFPLAAATKGNALQCSQSPKGPVGQTCPTPEVFAFLLIPQRIQKQTELSLLCHGRHRRHPAARARFS